MRQSILSMRKVFLSLKVGGKVLQYDSQLIQIIKLSNSNLSGPDFVIS